MKFDELKLNERKYEVICVNENKKILRLFNKVTKNSFLRDFLKPNIYTTTLRECFVLED